MRVLAHLLSVVLLLPGLLFAVAFLAVDHITSRPSWLDFFFAMLNVALILLPWALVMSVLLLAIAMFGFSARHRWAAALCVAGIVTASTAILLWLGDVPTKPEDAGIFVPGAVALLIAVWLSISEWPGRLVKGRRTP